ncbi:MAG: nicotinate (nicotinamide) nucleotide adenylyltransferase [Bacteroidia bacterium]|nr:nicotinate (nicotinamide) nucleotide adenylyltransferase [Bacteroidia bacterium]
MKVGLYFGSFNPIHKGHIAVAEYMQSKAKMDEVWLVVSPQNPFKNKESLIDESLRIKMVSLAIEGNPALKACDVEFSLKKPSYTFNTLSKLKEMHPSHSFSIIMGADNLEFLNNWYRITDILEQYPMHVYQRNNEILKSPIQGDFTYHNAPQINISSTDIRHKIRSNASIKDLVSQKVEQFILKNKLYLN